jgi:branched-chain amino acid transport system substrate-binding protein
MANQTVSTGDPARLNDLKDILELLYEKLGAFEKARISSNSKRAKLKFKKVIKREILPDISKYEQEYWELNPQEEIISREEDASQLEEVEQAVESIKRISSNYPPELISLLKEIRNKLCEPDKEASAKLKVVLPLIPTIASYELEMETEGLMSGVWKAIREKVRVQQGILIPPEKLEKAKKNWDKEIKRINSSQPKWLVIGAIAFLLASTAGIIHVLKSPPKNPPSVPVSTDATDVPGISIGEEILITQDIPDEKVPDEKVKEFEKAFADKDYQQFRSLLGNYLEQNPNSPELWVYWNNAKAALLSKNPIKIAVSIPIETNPNVAQEILRGVALAQNEINDDSTANGINGQLLQVVIANDNNNSELANKVAKKFAQDPSISAVVGHNASNASIAAQDIYKNSKLVMITPTSLSDRLQSHAYIFRMVPQPYQLARYVQKQYPNSILGTCTDPDTADNNHAFITQFNMVLEKKTIELPCDFLANEKLTDNALALDQEVTKILEKIEQQKIDSLVLSPYIERIAEMTDVLQAVRNKNSEIRLYGNPTLSTSETLEAGQAVEGLILSVPYYPDDNQSKSFQFQQEFQQLYQALSDNWRTAMAYDATGIVIHGLEKISEGKQQIRREQLDNVLNSIIYNGATGKNEFSNQGINENYSETIIQIKNGQFTPLSF